MNAAYQPCDLLRLCPSSFTTSTSASRLRNLVTPRSYDLDRPGLVPYVWDSTASPFVLNSSLYPPSIVQAPVTNAAFTANTLAALKAAYTSLQGGTPSSSEFDPNSWRSLLSKLGKINLNRTLQDFPTATTTATSLTPWDLTNATTKTQVLNAIQDRQQLASDIFNALQQATGALSPSAVDALAATVTTKQQQKDALRYLAQVAVNIVDFIDADSYSTAYNWAPNINLSGKATKNSNTITFTSPVNTSSLLVGMTVTGAGGEIPAGTTITAITSTTSITISQNATATMADTLTFFSPSFWVYGVETPRLVINEVYAQFDSPVTPPILTGQATKNSNTITFAAPVNTNSLVVGMTVTGAGGEIPAGTTITAITSATSITLSQNATATMADNLTFFSPITGASNTSPIVITTSASTAGLVSGQTVQVSGVKGNTAANGTWIISNVTATGFTLNGSDGTASGAYTTGGTWSGSFNANFWLELANPFPTTASYGTAPNNVADNPTYSTDTTAYFNSSSYQMFIINNNSHPVLGASNPAAPNPIVITTDSTASLATGQSVVIQGVLGNSDANGTWTIKVIDGATFSLNGSTGNGAYTTGGTWNLTFNTNVPITVGGQLQLPANTTGSLPSLTLTGQTTTGSNAITGLALTSNLYLGMTVSGAGIPANATVTAFTSANSITISQPATATSPATGVPLTMSFTPITAFGANPVNPSSYLVMGPAATGYAVAEGPPGIAAPQQTTQMSISAPFATSTYTILLQRLLNPCLPPNSDPTNTTTPYNPYITVDYVDGVTTYNAFAANLTGNPIVFPPSQGRAQPWAGNIFNAQTTASAAAGGPKNTFGAKNDNVLVGTTTYDWLVHPDRAPDQQGGIAWRSVLQAA